MSTTGKEQAVPPTDAVGQITAWIAGQFPPHLRDWAEHLPMPNMPPGGAGEAFLTPDSKRAVERSSALTQEEVLALFRLHELENGYLEALDQAAETKLDKHTPVIKGNPVWNEAFTLAGWSECAADCYRELSQSSEPLEERVLRALALTSAVAQKEYSRGQNEPFTPWETQRLALIRIMNNALNSDNPGLVVNMDMGDGKTSAVIPLALPALLLIKPNWAITSLKPSTRDKTARRFNEIAFYLGLKSNIFSPTPSRRFGPLLGFSTSAKMADYLSGPVFMVKTDLGHFLERLQTETGLDFKPDPEIWGALADEVDEEEIAEALVPMVISGPEVPVEKWLWDRWRLFPPTDNGRTDWIKAVKKTIAPFSKSAVETLSEKTAEGKAESENLSETISFLVWTFANLKELDQSPARSTFFTSSGRIKEAAWIELYRRLANAAGELSGDPQKPFSEAWEEFAAGLVPAQADTVIEQVWAEMTEGVSHRQTESGKIVPLSPRTGWPHPNREYEPLYLLATAAKDAAFGRTSRFPETVHTYTDLMYPQELMGLCFGKVIGLTGTGTESLSAAWFRRYLGLDVTAIPPSHPRENLKNTVVVFPTKEEKAAWVLEKIGQTAGPIMLNLPDINEANQLAEKITGLYPGKTVRLLTADTILKNEKAVPEITGQAGKKGAVTIAVKLANRELDIVPDSLALTAINFEPGEYAADDLQFGRRAARAGRRGWSYLLVGPEDGILKRLEKSKKLQRALKTKNPKKMLMLVEQEQKKNSEGTIADLEAQYRRIAPLVRVRADLFRRDDDVRRRVSARWCDFLELAATRYGEYHLGFRGKVTSWESRLSEYTLDVYRLYADLIRAASGNDWEKGLDRIVKKSAGYTTRAQNRKQRNRHFS